MKATEEHLKFLDELWESGATNISGAGYYVEDEFGLSIKDARDVLLDWKRTFEERHPELNYCTHSFVTKGC